MKALLYMKEKRKTIVKEVVIDAYGCRQELQRKDIARESVNVLRKAAENVGATVIDVHCSTYTIHGFTTVALLAESHIILATWPEHNYASINIYLCNPDMSHEIVRKQIFDYIKPTKWCHSWFRHVQISPHKSCRIFLAAPFTRYIQQDGFDSTARSEIILLLEHLRNSGYEVFSSHVRENFGADLMLGPVCTPLDFEEMRLCDIVVAMVSDKSYGVCVELGWASSLHKPVILYNPYNRKSSSPLIEGLSQITKVDIVCSQREIVPAIENMICPTSLNV